MDNSKTTSASPRRGLPGRLALLLPVPATALVVLGARLGHWWLPPAALLVLSATTYALFALDKRRARAGAWRVSEITLHLLELAGGWPGAVLAQHRLRHKSGKVSYRIVLGLIIAGHNILAADWLLGWPLARACGRLWRTFVGA